MFEGRLVRMQQQLEAHRKLRPLSSPGLAALVVVFSRRNTTSCLLIVDVAAMLQRRLGEGKHMCWALQRGLGRW
jgi:hypothetical protein